MTDSLLTHLQQGLINVKFIKSNLTFQQTIKSLSPHIQNITKHCQ